MCHLTCHLTVFGGRIVPRGALGGSLERIQYPLATAQGLCSPRVDACECRVELRLRFVFAGGLLDIPNP